jgi:hypothetical protein
MSAHLHDLHGVRVLETPAEGGPVRSERDATDLIGLGFEQGAEWVAVPAARLGDDFFHLANRIAGETIQKFVNYQMKLAVMGDISGHVAQSGALRDFVYESNRGRHVWFVADLAELERRLAPAG